MTPRKFILRLAAGAWVAFQSTLSYAQVEDLYNPLKVIPPAPTAASLGAYGNVPVGHYTGTPDISVPLYQIQTTAFNWPVSLRYNASGVKPNDEASWVGLGWSLSAGGVITRTVRGLDDLVDGSRKGYYHAEALPDEYNATPAQKDEYFDKIVEGERDAEPDIFSYNFGAYSGKFVLGKLADGSPIFFDNRNNLRVQFFPSTNGCPVCSAWIITDPQGYEYHFATREKTRDYFYTSATSDFPQPQGILGLTETTEDLITAWHLDKVVAPNREEILFVFVPGNPSLGPLQKTEHQANLLQINQSGYCSGTTPTLQNVYLKYTASRTVNYEFHLDKIIFSQGSIEFLRTDRNDAESLNSSYKQPKLSEILIKDVTGKSLKKFKLNYSYFTAAGDTDLRLKLDAVTEFSGDGALSLPPHTFNYFEPNNLPPRQTKAVDHWGFSNGLSGNSLLPQQNFTYFGVQYTIPGANRAASNYVGDIQKGTLRSITYPTGGRTDFDYEVHQFKNWLPEPGLSPPLLSSETAEASSQNTGTNGVVAASPFHLNWTTSVDLTASWWKDAQSPPAFPEDNHFAWLEKDGTIVYHFNSGGGLDEDTPIKATETFPPGDYVIKVKYVPGYITIISAGWRAVADGNPVGTGGGLRIGRITQHDNNGVSHVRRFKYNNPITNIPTGRLFVQPKYRYFMTISQMDGNCVYSGDYLVRAGASVASPGLSSLGVIGYDKVTELIGENGEGGRTEYGFYNDADTQDDDFPGIPTSGNAYNGKVSYSLVMDASLNPIERTEYSYDAKEAFTIQGIKLYTPLFTQLPDDDEYGSSNHQVAYFHNMSWWVVLSSMNKTTYLDGGNLSVHELNTYADYVHKQITSRTINTSDGKELTTTYKYPHDFVGQQPYSEMVNVRHIWATVIEQSVFKNNSFLESSQTNYAFWNGAEWSTTASDLIVPQSVVTKVLDNGTDTRVSYHTYDNKGNITTSSRANDAKYSFLWGYNKTYNTARIANAEAKNVFHTSFEEGDGNSTNGDAKTGNRSKTNGLDKTLSGLTNGNYRLSYWKKNGSSWVPQSDPVTVINGTYRILLTGQIDEVRFYPEHASMITYTYSPLVGMTSQCDENNIVTRYEYDDFGRLRLIIDDKGNIVKRLDYHYQTR